MKMNAKEENLVRIPKAIKTEKPISVAVAK
jgi:hypothetical protein